MARENMVSTADDGRVPLTPQTKVADFRDFYWLKEELLQFCRDHGLSASGGKREIEDRIEYFLRTGRGQASAPSLQGSSVEARRVNSAQVSELSMDTRAPSGFRCTQEARAFFVKHLGVDFRFTVTLQKYIKEHPDVTFRQIGDEWNRQKELRKAGALETTIAPQFQYNQFTRDYFSDPSNKNKSRRDCIEAWKRTRARRGDNKYRPVDDEP